MKRKAALGPATRLLVALLAVFPVIWLAAPSAPATPPVGGSSAADTTPSLSTTIGDFESPSENWTFYPGSEYPGASGDFTLDPTTSDTGQQSGKLIGDFTGGGAYVAVSRTFTPVDLTALDFAIKTSDVGKITLRLTDSTGQIHQQSITLDGSTDWQNIDVTDFAGGASSVYWGGASDGKWHAPATAISFVLDRGAVTAGLTSGTLWLDDVTASYPAPSISLSQTAVGNVFSPGQAPTIGVTTAGDTLDWTATDANGAVVASGRQAVSDVQSTLALPIDRLGWFSISVTASRNGTVLDTATTTLARLPHPAKAAADGTAFGVSAHYGFSGVSRDSIPLLAKAGITNERDEMMWQSVEPTPGTYVFPFDGYQTALVQNGVSPLIILDYGNSNYDDGKAPTSDAAITAFAKYADALVGHYAGKVSSYEIWNEWNGGAGNAPKTPASYLALEKAVYETVKADHPDVTLVAPALALNDMQWLEQWMQLGGLKYTDAVSLHPYFYPQPPELLSSQLSQVTKLITQYGAGVPKPIWITEQGWPTGTAVQANSENDQASDLARSAMLALQAGAARFFNYDFIDDGTDPSNLEHNFGLLHNASDPLGAYTPKPAYAAYATLTSLLTGAMYAHSEDAGTGVNDLVFDRNGQTIRGLWASSPTQVTLHTRQQVVITDLYGNAQTYQPDPSGAIALTLTGEPVYVTGPVSSVTTGAISSIAISSAFVGNPLDANWTVDNTGSHAPTSLTLTVDGSRYHLDVPAGRSRTTTISLPAPTATGTLSVVGDLSRNDSRIGRLRADTKVQTAIQLRATHVIDSSGAQQLQFVVSNVGSAAQSIGSLQWTLGSQTGAAMAGETVPGNGQQTFVVPYQATTKQDYTGKLTLTGQQPLTVNGTLVPVAASELTVVPEHTISVDGQLPVMTGLTPIQLDQDGTVAMPGYTGSADLSGPIWLTYDAQNLYLTADLTDDVQYQDQTGANIWQGDGVQLAVGSGAPGEQTSWTEVGAALTPDGPQLYRWLATGDATPGNVPGGQVAVTRDDASRHTLYEIAIPWSQLQPIRTSDRLISVSLLVNDNDGAGRKGWIQWGGGIGDAKNSAEFNAAELE